LKKNRHCVLFNLIIYSIKYRHNSSYSSCNGFVYDITYIYLLFCTCNAFGCCVRLVNICLPIILDDPNLSSSYNIVVSRRCYILLFDMDSCSLPIKYTWRLQTQKEKKMRRYNIIFYFMPKPFPRGFVLIRCTQSEFYFSVKQTCSTVVFRAIRLLRNINILYYRLSVRNSKNGLFNHWKIDMDKKMFELALQWVVLTWYAQFRITPAHPCNNTCYNIMCIGKYNYS